MDDDTAMNETTADRLTLVYLGFTMLFFVLATATAYAVTFAQPNDALRSLLAAVWG